MRSWKRKCSKQLEKKEEQQFMHLQAFKNEDKNRRNSLFYPDEMDGYSIFRVD